MAPDLKHTLVLETKAPKVLNQIRSSFRYIPRIELGSTYSIENQLNIVKQAQSNYLVIGLEDSLYHGKIQRLTFAKKKYAQPLHNLIDFEGKIILAPNFHDKFCNLSFQDPEQYCAIIETLQPDIVTTADGCFQYTKPNFLLQYQLEKVMNLNHQMTKLKIPLIGLLQPYIPFISLSVAYFSRMGLKVLALPAQEMSKKRREDPEEWIYLRKLNRYLYSNEQKRDLQFFGLSIAPSPKLSFDYCSTLSWRMVQKQNGTEKQIAQLEKLRRYEAVAKIQALNANLLRKNQIFQKLNR